MKRIPCDRAEEGRGSGGPATEQQDEQCDPRDFLTFFSSLALSCPRASLGVRGWGRDGVHFTIKCVFSFFLQSCELCRAKTALPQVRCSWRGVVQSTLDAHRTQTHASKKGWRSAIAAFPAHSSRTQCSGNTRQRARSEEVSVTGKPCKGTEVGTHALVQVLPRPPPQSKGKSEGAQRTACSISRRGEDGGVRPGYLRPRRPLTTRLRRSR